MNQIIHGDSLEVMRKMPDNAFDFVITDPPYGIGAYSSGTMGGAGLAKQSAFAPTDWDEAIPGKEYFEEMMRVSRHQIIFGGNYFTDFLRPSSCWLVWDKQNGENTFADAELAWTSLKGATRIIKYRWQGMLQGDMGNKETRVHPTQKPLPVMTWIVRRFTEMGQSVLDPFAGSGTTLLAAAQEGRRYCGIERDGGYHAIAVDRLKVFQPSLFR